MKLYRGLSVWQKPKDIFSQIISSLWKEHNKRFGNKQWIKSQAYQSLPYLTELYLKKTVIWNLPFSRFKIYTD